MVVYSIVVIYGLLVNCKHDNFLCKVAYTSGLIFQKIINGYPIYFVQIIYHQVHQMHK